MMIMTCWIKNVWYDGVSISHNIDNIEDGFIGLKDFNFLNIGYSNEVKQKSYGNGYISSKTRKTTREIELDFVIFAKNCSSKNDIISQYSNLFNTRPQGYEYRTLVWETCDGKKFTCQAKITEVVRGGLTDCCYLEGVATLLVGSNNCGTQDGCYYSVDCYCCNGIHYNAIPGFSFDLDDCDIITCDDCDTQEELYNPCTYCEKQIFGQKHDKSKGMNTAISPKCINDSLEWQFMYQHNRAFKVDYDGTGDAILDITIQVTDDRAIVGNVIRILNYKGDNNFDEFVLNDIYAKKGDVIKINKSGIFHNQLDITNKKKIGSKLPRLTNTKKYDWGNNAIIVDSNDPHGLLHITYEYRDTFC